MSKVNIILSSIIIWWGIELLYIGFMLSGFSFWTTVKKDKFSYNLYLIELIINIIFIDFWILTWKYKVILKKKNKHFVWGFFLFVHCYYGLRVFFVNNVDDNFRRRIYAYISWVSWFIMCIYIQITYINPKLTNIKQSSTIDISRILSNIF